ncbi:MAG: FliI/YscN family ATPase [Phycisphaerales bacterium]|nr:FliI/YscN family ATPase [Planctomycetota bacterium]
MTVLGAQIHTLRRLQAQEVVGTVAAVRGLALFVDDLLLPVGSLVRLPDSSVHQPRQRDLGGEVIGFDGSRSIVMLFGSNDGIAPGAQVVSEPTAGTGRTVAVGDSLRGRVIDGLGRPIDGGRPLSDVVARSIDPPPTGALCRRRIDEPLPTGVRVIDAMITIGKGQRVGIFSGPGIGKSTLIATIAQNTIADISVIALVGERGREVREFIDQTLGPQGLARSVMVVATGDESPLLRVRASLVACTVAEHFRDQGADVVLLMDSLTRLAQAQRQIGLTVGEQPATKGYTPSVFAMLPKLLERAGAIEGRGSITGFYSVLVEGDDLTEPVSDAARGVLDGHLSLSRRLAARGHYPAADMLESISRVADIVCDEPHRLARRVILKLLAAYAEAEELINIGAYARGSNPDCDVAITLKPKIDEFLRQEIGEKAEYPNTCRALVELAEAAKHEYDKIAAATAPPSPSRATP